MNNLTPKYSAEIQNIIDTLEYELRYYFDYYVNNLIKKGVFVDDAIIRCSSDPIYKSLNKLHQDVIEKGFDYYVGQNTHHSS